MSASGSDIFENEMWKNICLEILYYHIRDVQALAQKLEPQIPLEL